MRNRLYEDEDYRIWTLLAQTRALLYMARGRELIQYDITPRQAAALFAIQAIGSKATPAKVSRWLCREPHTVSSLLSRMEGEGLIRKTKDLDRKNLVRITLTEKGKKAYDQSLRRESIHEIMPALSKEERQLLSSCLEKLRDKALFVLGKSKKTLYPLPNE